jgi:uncharacterized membrane protein YeaQ/YmgE (transglycosylase-associated protein family)
MSLLYAIVIGIVAGWLAGLIVKGRGFGMVGDLIVGIVGAVVGSFVFDILGITTYGLTGTLVMSVIGAVLFLALVKVLKHA